MTAKDYSISAFFPAYNDVCSIGKIIKTMVRLLPELTNDYEIVVVDDGSADGTANLLRTLEKEYRFLKVIRHEVNQGYGGALITGFDHCSKELIFYTDGDGQYDVEELTEFLAVFDERVDLVNGYKISRSDPWHRIVLGFIYQRLMRILFHLAVRDVDCDFRLFRRSLLTDNQLTCDSGVICIEMMKKFQSRGCRMIEVPVHHYHRIHGASEFFRLRHLRRVFGQLFVAWWMLVASPVFRRHLPFSGAGARAKNTYFLR